MTRKPLQVALLMTAVCASYLWVNQYAYPTSFLLPFTLLDGALPFSPWALPIYLSHFVFLPWALLSIRSDTRFRETCASFAAATVLCCAVFLLYPTRFARPDWPPGYGFALLRLIDTPANCFPSLHVALAALAAWALRGTKRSLPAAAWTAAIALSTVLVKQHYFVDIPGGLAVAALAGAAVEARRAFRRAPGGAGWGRASGSPRPLDAEAAA